jgi:hypothetical protein
MWVSAVREGVSAGGFFAFILFTALACTILAQVGACEHSIHIIYGHRWTLLATPYLIGSGGAACGPFQGFKAHPNDFHPLRVFHLMCVVQVHGEVWLLYPWLASFTGPKREKTRLAPLFLLCAKALQRGNAAPTSPRLDATQKVQLGSVEEEAAWTLRATLLHAFVWVRGRHARTCITRMVCLTNPNRYVFIYICL